MRRSKDRDEDLARRMADGDEQALERVYETHSGAVFAFLVSRMRDREGAEDVLQQVFVEVWQKADRFDAERGKLASWIMSIASSRSIDSLRRRTPEPRDPVVIASDGADASPGGVEEFLADWEFARILDRLPDSEAELLKMRFSDDLSQSEIAERTGIPIGTVKMRMVSGLNTLRSEMGAS